MTELLQFTLFGLMLGCVYAIAAMGLVLTYTVTGVFNFAHGAVGMLAAFAYFELRVRHGVPTPLALAVVVLILAPVLGLAAERLLRRFEGADYATSLVVTVALTVGLLGLAQRIFDPGQARNVPFLFGARRFVVADVPITYDRIAQVIVAAAVAFGLRFLLFGTPLGARMRAVVDDRQLAGLNGVRSRSVARISWMIGFCLAALGGVLFAAGHNLNAVILTLLVLNAYGAAMIGRLRSLPMTVLGALLLGLCQELTNVSWLWPSSDTFNQLRLAIPGVFLLVAVLLVPSFRLSAGRVVGRDQPKVPTLRRSFIGAIAFVGVVAAAIQVLPSQDHTHVVRALVIGTVALSLVALTGLSGQVSLAQYLFVGVGAFVTGKTFGGGSVLGMLLGGLAAGALGALVALPAVRLRGLHLALSTFGIALIGREAILGDRRVFGLGGFSVGRPHVLGISTNSDGAFAIWAAVVFAALAVLIGVVRRSWFGRQLVAVGDSEVAAATLGMRVRSAKVAIFAVSAFIAGCAGALFGGLAGAVQGLQFDPVNSLVILLFAYVGGITTASGAAIAGTLFALLVYTEAHVPDLAGLVFVAIGAAAIGLGRQPNGVAGVLFDAIDRLRALAVATSTRRKHRVAVRAALGLVVATAFVGGVPGKGSGTADAQTLTALGGLRGRAAASGLYALYSPEGLLPISPLAEVGSPDVLATIASGPATYARASVLDPGDILANPDAVLALASSGYPQGTIPPYPYRVSATSGVGEPTAESDPAPGLRARVAVDGSGSTARANMPASDTPAVATAGSITSTATTKTDGASATVTARTVITNFKLLGLLSIDSIVTDVKATSNGIKRTLEGGTTVTGASLAGQRVTVDADGIHAGSSSGPPNPILAALSSNKSLDDALASVGIRVAIARPIKQAGATSGQLASTGLRVDFELSDRTVPAITALTRAVPPIENPAPGAPSVEDLLAAARARHLASIEVGRASVSLTARTLPSLLSAGTPLLGDGLPSAAIPPVADASTLVGAPPSVGAANPASRGGAVPTAAVGSPRWRTTLGRGIGALALLLLLAPLVGDRLARLAGVVLATDQDTCPREER